MSLEVGKNSGTNTGRMAFLLALHVGASDIYSVTCTDFELQCPDFYRGDAVGLHTPITRLLGYHTRGSRAYSTYKAAMLYYVHPSSMSGGGCRVSTSIAAVEADGEGKKVPD